MDFSNLLKHLAGGQRTERGKGKRDKNERNSGRRTDKKMKRTGGMSGKVFQCAKPEMPDCDEWDGNRENFIGIVVPPGGGKTYMADKFGWLDADDLIDRLDREQLRDVVMNNVAAGMSVSEAIRVLDGRRKETLNLLYPWTTQVVLAHSVQSLEQMGVDCMGRIQLWEPLMEAGLKGREEHEKVFARMMNKFSEQEKSHVPLFPAHKHRDVICYIMKVCGYCDIPVPVPHLYDGEMIGYTMPELLASENLALIIEAEKQARVPRCHVDYMVREQGMRSYMGYGVTVGDWARALAKCSHTNASDLKDIEGTIYRGLDLARASEITDIAEHEDVQQILKMQENAESMFALNLIMHWKMVGIRSPLRSSIFRLYGVHQCRWSRAMGAVRDVVKMTDNLLGHPLDEDERRTLSELWWLGRYKRRSFMDTLSQSGRSGYARRCSPAMLREAKKSFRMLYTKDETRVPGKELSRILDMDRWECLSGMLSSNVTLRDLASVPGANGAEQIALVMVGAELARDEGSSAVELKRMYTSVSSKWARASMRRDEWSDAIMQMLGESIPTDIAIIIGRAAVNWYYTPGRKETKEWSSIVDGCTRTVITTCLVRAEEDRELEVSDGDIPPDVINAEAMTRLAVRMELPQAMGGGWLKLTEDQRLTTLMLSEAKSPTLAAMEVVNFNNWMGRRRGVKVTMAAVARWIHATRYMVYDGDLLVALAKEHFRQATGHSLTDERKRYLVSYVHVRRSDGGIGLPDENGHVYERGTLGIRRWAQPDGRKSYVDDTCWDLKPFRLGQATKRKEKVKDTVRGLEKCDVYSEVLRAEGERLEALDARIVVAAPLHVALMIRCMLKDVSKRGNEEAFRMIARITRMASAVEHVPGMLADILNAVGNYAIE
ncbi:P3 [Macrophomina phaseolina chrysovirus 1]|uniref:p3 n=1 Tax=Macrophomina phaseolina chrysovirus 1 TaxID=1708483 RepID=A0A0M4KRA2_9VIRU|nr:P3 [Macrophomina phaseolina chrysovirus 1]ALD89092.1 P3 [Macrophomina phaseolina chrysovirus 1]